MEASDNFYFWKQKAVLKVDWGEEWAWVRKKNKMRESLLGEKETEKSYMERKR